MAGIPVVLQVCKTAETLRGKVRRKPIKHRARRFRQGKAAPAAVRIQHKGRAPRDKITEYRRRNREVQTQKEKRRPRFGSLNETRPAETVVVERNPKEHKKERRRNTLTHPRYEAVLVRTPSQSGAQEDRVVKRAYLKHCILQKVMNTALPPRVVSRHGVGQTESMVVRKRSKRWYEEQTKSGGITRNTTMLKPNSKPNNGCRLTTRRHDEKKNTLGRKNDHDNTTIVTAG